MRVLIFFTILTQFLTTIHLQAQHGPEMDFSLIAPVEKYNMMPRSSGQLDGWHSDLLEIRNLLKTSTGAEINIAVLDTGIDDNHPDLIGKVVIKKDFTGDERPPSGHGTHIAGEIAAIDNDFGAMGFTVETKLFDLRVLNSEDVGSAQWVANAIRFAVEMDAHIINMSLGSSDYSKNIHDAIKYAISKDVLVVAAAGNSGAEGVSYPGKLPEVLTVAAVDQTIGHPSWSSEGKEVDICAPGVRIFSTLPGAEYGAWSGTSQATPLVSALCALLMSHNSLYYKNPEVLQKDLKGFAKPQGDPTSFGAGLIDISQMLNYNPLQEPPQPADVKLPLWTLVFLGPVLGFLAFLNYRK